MENKFAVIGLGQFGTSIALTLAEKGAEVMAIDRDYDKIERIKNQVAYAVAMDASDTAALKDQKIEEMDAVVVAIGEDFEGLILTTVGLQELKIKNIIARSMSERQTQILKKLGIQRIFNPEESVGRDVANMLLEPDILASIELDEDHEIVEIQVPGDAVGKTISEIKFREKYGLNVITIRKNSVNEEGNILDSQIIGVPKPDTKFDKHDTIFLIGKKKDIAKFNELLN